MATHIFPSSYRCDCGHESHFCENTVREMVEMSLRRNRRSHFLCDSERDEHQIVFTDGHSVSVICPRLGKCPITESI